MNTKSTLLAAACFAGLSLSTLLAGPYYPDLTSPVNDEPYLAAVESHLPPGVFFQFPPYRLPSQAQVDTALAAAVAADPTHAGELFLAVAKYGRAGATTGGKQIPPATLIKGQTGPTLSDSQLDAVNEALLGEYPEQVVPIGGATARFKAALVLGPYDWEPVIIKKHARAAWAGFTPDKAPIYATALALVKGVQNPTHTPTENAERIAEVIQGMIAGLQEDGIEEPFLDDVARGCGKGHGTIIWPHPPVIPIRAFLAQATPGRWNAISIGSGLAWGFPGATTTPADLQAMKDEVAADTNWSAWSDDFAAALDTAWAARGWPKGTAAAEVAALITADQNHSAAYTNAALMVKPGEAATIWAAALTATFPTGGPTTSEPTGEWLRIGLAGYPKFGPKAIVPAIERLEATGLLDTPAQGEEVMRGAAGGCIPLFPLPFPKPHPIVKEAAKFRPLKTLDWIRGAIAEITGSAVRFGCGGVIPAAFAASSTDSNAALLQAALLATADHDERANLTAAAVVADIKNADALILAALDADPSTADDEAIGAGGKIAKGATKSVKRSSLVADAIAAGDPTIPVVLGALTAAPKEAAAIFGAAFDADPTLDLETTAFRLQVRGATAGALTLRLADAEDEDTTAPGTSLALVFDLIEKEILAHPKDYEAIVKGAVTVLPQYAHHIGHAAAFRAPLKASKIVPVLFNDSGIESFPNPAASTAALTAALTNGIRESAQAATMETKVLTATITAAMKAAIPLAGPVIPISDGLGGTLSISVSGPGAVLTGYISQVVADGDAALSADALTVLTAAVKAGFKKTDNSFNLQIAQATAQAARWIAGPSFTDVTPIVNAILAANPTAIPAQITNAANFGISEAALGNPGPGAAGVRNYAHHGPGTDPVKTLDTLEAP